MVVGSNPTRGAISTFAPISRCQSLVQPARRPPRGFWTPWQRIRESPMPKGSRACRSWSLTPFLTMAATTPCQTVVTNFMNGNAGLLRALARPFPGDTNALASRCACPWVLRPPSRTKPAMNLIATSSMVAPMTSASGESASGESASERTCKSRLSRPRRSFQRLMLSLVPRKGLEPSRPCGHWHLKPARLPIPPPGQGCVASARRGRNGLTRRLSTGVAPG